MTQNLAERGPDVSAPSLPLIVPISKPEPFMW